MELTKHAGELELHFSIAENCKTRTALLGGLASRRLAEKFEILSFPMTAAPLLSQS